MNDLPRRDFLKLSTQVLLVASGLLGLGALLRYLGFAPETASRTQFDLGPAADYPPGSRRLLPEIPAILIHDGAGFSALSLTCPHLGCTVEENSGGFICPCHGSRFDTQGSIQRGPATQPLRMLRVEVSDDDQLHLFLD